MEHAGAPHDRGLTCMDCGQPLVVIHPDQPPRNRYGHTSRDDARNCPRPYQLRPWPMPTEHDDDGLPGDHYQAWMAAGRPPSTDPWWQGQAQAQAGPTVGAHLGWHAQVHTHPPTPTHPGPPMVPMSQGVADDNTLTDEQRAVLRDYVEGRVHQPMPPLPTGMETHHDQHGQPNANASNLIQQAKPGTMVAITMGGRTTHHVVTHVDQDQGTITLVTYPPGNANAWNDIPAMTYTPNPYLPVDAIHDHVATQE